jgi:hypothetical protein
VVVTGRTLAGGCCGVGCIMRPWATMEARLADAVTGVIGPLEMVDGSSLTRGDEEDDDWGR